jgi:tetratricopeptide (TPR) repeat protein
MRHLFRSTPLLGGAALLAAVAVLLLPAAPARAQQRGDDDAPGRPRLEAGADTNDWQAYYQYGLSHVRQWPDRATAAFYWATRLAPDRAEPMYARWVATWISRRGMLVEYAQGTNADSPEARAVDSLQTLALLRNPFVHQGLERLFESAVNDRKLGVGAWEWDDGPVTQGWVYYTEGKFDKSAAEFAQALKERPERTALHVYRARAFVGVQKFDSAAAELTAALDDMRRHDRKRLVYWYDSKAMFEYSLGVLNVIRRDYPAAKAAYGRALEEDLTFYMAHAAIAGLALTQGDTAQAISEYEDALAVNPSDAVVQHDVGVVLMSSGRAADAVDHLRTAVKLAPDFAKARYNLAVALDLTGHGAEAAEQYAAFIARAPRSFAAQAETARGRIAALAEKKGGD